MADPDFDLDATHPDGPQAHAAMLLRVGAVCDAFEARLKAGDRPPVEGELGDTSGQERALLLYRLLQLEVDYRIGGGQSPSLEEYLARFPGPTALVRRVFAEVQARTAIHELASAPAPPGGREVPGYEVLSVLGRGGMGVVYKARHLALKRTVALKMVLAGSHAGEQDLARFKSEAETFARLQHPNIVQIYEVGDHAGLPYLSLEFCGGGSLDKKLAGTPFPPKNAAKLVETLARAMQAAHERGVVHRDLKPANVLLTEDGTSKVSDFGLARKLDEAGHTAPGAVIGTPSYMAPEQASGKGHVAEPPVDIYALGAVLYECLTGHPPFKGPTALETLAQVIQEEPVPPSRSQPRTPRDLETICLKCLRKEPARRYESARALADDLRRFLSGEPIRARPVGGGERLWRWCRRNRAVAGLIAAVFLLLLFTAGGSTIAAVWINHERNLSDAAREASARDADHARRALKLANASLDAAVNKITENPKLRDRGFFALRKELLADVLPHYAELAALQSDDPDLEAERARAFGKMGAIHMALGDNEQAVRDYREMESVFSSLMLRYSDVPAYQYAAALSQNDLAILLSERGAWDQTRAALDRGDEIAGPLVRDRPEVADHHVVRLKLRGNRAILLGAEGRYEAALEALGEAEQFEAEAEARFPGHVECRTLLGQFLTLRGSIYNQMSRLADAEQAHRRALAILRPLGEEPSAPPAQRERLGQAWLDLGTALSGLGRPKEARGAQQNAVALTEGVCQEVPNVPAYQDQLAQALTNLAYLTEELGDAKGATELRRRSLDNFEKLAAGYPAHSDFKENLGIFYALVGNAEFKRGKYGTGLEWLTKATGYMEPLFNDSPHTAMLRQKLAEAHAGRGGCLFGLGRYVEAIQSLDRALELDDRNTRMTARVLRGVAIQKIRQEIVPALKRARAGDHVEAAAMAAALAKGPNAHPEMDYNAACVFAICADKVKDKDSVAAAGYAAQAVALLRQANAGGFFKDPAQLKQLQKDKDLDPLRERSDFGQVVKEVTGK